MSWRMVLSLYPSEFDWTERKYSRICGFEPRIDRNSLCRRATACVSLENSFKSCLALMMASSFFSASPSFSSFDTKNVNE